MIDYVKEFGDSKLFRNQPNFKKDKKKRRLAKLKKRIKSRSKRIKYYKENNLYLNI